MFFTKIKNKSGIIYMYMDKIDYKEIRHQFDHTSGVLYVSIVDIIKLLGVSTDPRNYWKTLKNRLKNTHLELVTKCNQLKMRANDGKMYLTDTTDSDNCLLLVQQISPNKVRECRKIFTDIQKDTQILEDKEIKLSTVERNSHQIKLDLFKRNNVFIINALLAGAEKNDISIIASSKNILIESKTMPPQNIKNGAYAISELMFGKYSREIDLPEEIEIEKIETFYSNGLLEIRLPILDKSYTRIIKVK